MSRPPINPSIALTFCSAAVRPAPNGWCKSRTQPRNQEGPMVFDPKIHEVDPVTGFHVYKGDGRRVGMDAAPIARVSDETEFPKWVVPHGGHVHRHPATAHVSTPGWAEHHE